MRSFFRRAAFAAGFVAVASIAHAQSPSTSAINPTAVGPSGVITGNYPAGETETSYYFSVDLKPGDLATQMSFLGRASRDKFMEFDLKDPKGKLVRYSIVLKLKGPETTSFQIALGGAAFPVPPTSASSPTPFSRSYLAPSQLPKDGMIAGSFPGGEKITTYYYFAADLKPGDLMTQVSFAGRTNAPKMVQLELLDAKGRSTRDSSVYIMGELDAKNERSRTFPIDSSGRYVLRVGVAGAEGTRFKVEIGGSAYQAMN
jgi:hypothetical protein